MQSALLGESSLTHRSAVVSMGVMAAQALVIARGGGGQMQSVTRIEVLVLTLTRLRLHVVVDIHAPPVFVHVTASLAWQCSGQSFAQLDN